MMKSKEQQYKYVLAELQSFYGSYNLEYKLSLNARYASIVSLLHNHISGLFFVGFYIVVDAVNQQNEYIGNKYLEMGPYMSTILATPRIAYGKGQCGQCWAEKKVQLVGDVTQCKNYIACDNETKSEIVLPIIVNGEVIAVLDIDSDELNRFDEVDVEYLNMVIEYIYK